MTIVQTVILGIVQGITEFLPVSSSGHLILVPSLLGWDASGLAFDVMVHVGTFVAVLWVFRTDVWQMVKAVVCPTRDRLHARLAWMLMVGTVPVIVAGLFFGDVIDVTMRTPGLVAASLIVWGVALVAADVLLSVYARIVKTDAQVTWRTIVLIGCAQVLALIPGTSRSGITMTAALLLGYSRAMAARISFLLSIPAIGGAAVYVLAQHIGTEGLWSVQTLVGVLASAVAGAAAIRWLLAVVSRWRFVLFGVYRVVLGIIVLIILT